MLRRNLTGWCGFKPQPDVPRHPFGGADELFHHDGELLNGLQLEFPYIRPSALLTADELQITQNVRQDGLKNDLKWEKRKINIVN